jgi:hypothetical protein
LEVHSLREPFEGESPAKSLMDGLLADVPASGPGADKEDSWRSSCLAQQALEIVHQRPRAAQPSEDASQVRVQKGDFSSPERTAAYAEEATGCQSGAPSCP